MVAGGLVFRFERGFARATESYGGGSEGGRSPPASF
jgi:hypothetical protein